MGYHIVKASTFVDNFSSSASVSTFFKFSKYFCIVCGCTKMITPSKLIMIDCYLNGVEIVGISLISLQLLDEFSILSSLSKIYHIFCIGKEV